MLVTLPGSGTGGEAADSPPPSEITIGSESGNQVIWRTAMKITLLGDIVPDAHELAAIVNAIPDGLPVDEVVVVATGTTVTRRVPAMMVSEGSSQHMAMVTAEEPVFAVGVNLAMPMPMGERMPVEMERVLVPIRRLMTGGRP